MQGPTVEVRYRIDLLRKAALELTSNGFSLHAPPSFVCKKWTTT